ncbi:MAG: DUF4873 domain-containing protein [Hamadaea sp.]|uniref:DUF4873 domain-containing protein n=1 Tax=Hamadaea sp. TaxID=2024425 RepID=UPI0017F94ED2|nr:DUF4873 domain-containing protein [Hamadaea sp.]NUR73978.1 DUF4873 domain-containing protein [Hamadaea sp.]NUT22387.1 DUF4873 domain-containing protein [Hamadaea sp.]
MSYDGEAKLNELAVRVHLSGHWQPVDGRFHWGGRISPSTDVVQLVRSGRREVTVCIGEQSAKGRLGEVDPWGGVRVTGVGAPPWEEDEE